MRIVASDFQETKNINTEGVEPDAELSVPRRPRAVVNAPGGHLDHAEQGRLPAGARKLQVVATSPSVVSSVGFFDGNRQITRVRRNVDGHLHVNWRRRKGRARTCSERSPPTSRGREAEASRPVKVCR